MGIPFGKLPERSRDIAGRHPHLRSFDSTATFSQLLDKRLPDIQPEWQKVELVVRICIQHHSVVDPTPIVQKWADAYRRCGGDPGERFPSQPRTDPTTPHHPPGSYPPPHQPGGFPPGREHAGPRASAPGGPPPGHTAPPSIAAPPPFEPPYPPAGLRRRSRVAPVLITVLAIALVVCVATIAVLIAGMDKNKETAAAPGTSVPSPTSSLPASEPPPSSAPASAAPATSPAPAVTSPAPGDNDDPRRALDKHLTGIYEITVSDGNTLDIDTQSLNAPNRQDNELLLHYGTLLTTTDAVGRPLNQDVRLGLIDDKDVPRCAQRARLVRPQDIGLDLLQSRADVSVCVFTSQKRWAVLQPSAEQTTDGRAPTEVNFRVGFVK
ncbi:hypothetical protein [Streptomyces sp. NPDC090135]|uniref:hypothetical protein n=1 Tax=Streptomyces sp. NPDC090135 TaxID=3365957 RepID=UPI0038284573